MNLDILKSVHAAVALGIAIAFGSWWVLSGGRLGELPLDRGFSLASGWTALGLFVLVMGYVARKYIHKAGLSPEFKMAVPMERLERAEERLSAVRLRMFEGRLTDPKAILEEAHRILVEERVNRVMRVGVDRTGERLRLIVTPTQPLLPTSRWLGAHLYLGLAAAVLVVLHGGLAFDSPLAISLNGCSLLVIVSGLFGVYCWMVGPMRLTRLERAGGHTMTAERAHGLYVNLREKVEQARQEVDDLVSGGLESLTRTAITQNAPGSGGALSGLLALAPHQDLPVLRELDPKQRAQVEDWMALRHQLSLVEKRHGELMRAKSWIHAWRVVHVPAAFLLWCLLIVHVVSILWY
ncbi:MAG: hypothetical protein KDC38_01315 [Planctomycetes bacterium]|nr:hypothetical protein [Planctomycetota bacterium]